MDTKSCIKSSNLFIRGTWYNIFAPIVSTFTTFLSRRQYCDQREITLGRIFRIRLSTKTREV